jgi:hypothetical protein
MLHCNAVLRVLHQVVLLSELTFREQVAWPESVMSRARMVGVPTKC